MSKNPFVNIYVVLLESIEELAKVGYDISQGEAAITSLAKTLSDKESEIEKFSKVSGELCEFLETYDFNSGFQFDEIHGKLASLSALREKLVKMGVEAKALSAYPDCYGSAKAIETCKSLVVACRGRLSLNDIESVSRVVDSNTEKLLSIKDQFESDDYILGRIKNEIDSKKQVLSKYEAAFAELKHYVDGFPHSGQDNLAEVEKYINAVIQIDDLINSVGKQVALILPYCDRYQKKSVVSEYEVTEKEAYKHLVYNNTEKFKQTFEGILKKVQNVLSAFEEERDNLIELQSALEVRNPNIWKEDNERLLSQITKLLRGDVAKTKFDLVDVKKKIKNAKDKRKRDIQAMTNEYSWLLSEKHKAFHDRLISRYISYSEYKSEIDSVRGERNKKILKGIGIGVAVAVVIGLICKYWQVILGTLVVILVIGVFILFSGSKD